MKMRLVVGLALLFVAEQTQGVPSKGTAVTKPGMWTADIGQDAVRPCDKCKCSGDRRRRCNEDGEFGQTRNNCKGDRWWSDWGLPRRGQCKVNAATGKAVIEIKQSRTCGCDGNMPDGGCWEGQNGQVIDSYQTCKNTCLCTETTCGDCRLSMMSVRTREEPAGPFYCDATSLLPNCNDDGQCTQAFAYGAQGSAGQYRELDPRDAGHPQRTGNLRKATGSYTCPDMWPRVEIGSGEADVEVVARCGCGYTGNQTRTCRQRGCGAEWSAPDRSNCVKIDWLPGCDNWGECKLSAPGATCGKGKQRCRRRCNTENFGGRYEDCVHAAHAGCIDETMYLERDCSVAHANWDKWGPWGWVRDGEFHVGWDPDTGVYQNPKAVYYENEAQRGFNDRCCARNSQCAKQVRYYQCSSGKRKDCLDACRYGCYAGEAQEDVCRAHKGMRRVSGRPCKCEDVDKEIIPCPGGQCGVPEKKGVQ